MDVREKVPNGKRLIDANKLLKNGIRVSYGFDNGGVLLIPIGDVIRSIKKAPIIDAVEVVRCRECKHHRDKNEQERQYLVEDILICTSPDATDDCWNAVWPDHFCSYGELKEGDGILEET